MTWNPLETPMSPWTWDIIDTDRLTRVAVGSDLMSPKRFVREMKHELMIHSQTPMGIGMIAFVDWVREGYEDQLAPWVEPDDPVDYLVGGVFALAGMAAMFRLGGWPLFVAGLPPTESFTLGVVSSNVAQHYI